jgi:hypothetical protein
MADNTNSDLMNPMDDESNGEVGQYPYYHFGEVPFAPEHEATIQKLLDSTLPPEFVTFRQGPGGRMCSFVCI